MKFPKPRTWMALFAISAVAIAASASPQVRAFVAAHSGESENAWLTRFTHSLERGEWVRAPVDWEPDLDAAIARASAEEKPIFVLVYVKYLGNPRAEQC